MPTNFTHDALIFGGGIAGSVLAEKLATRGKRPLLIDDPSKSNCSRVAAGLMNPIGGKRLKLVWMADTLFPNAIDYYRALEKRCGARFFHPRPIARIFANQDERQIWQTRAKDPAYQSRVSELSSLELGYEIGEDSDGFAIPNAGYLDTNELLDILAAERAEADQLLSSPFHYGEISTEQDGVNFREFSAPVAVFAEGHLATRNLWFDFVPFKPAKGIIASITLAEPSIFPTGDDQPILLKSKFLIPRHDGVILVGATYNWEESNDSPDQAGIDELARFLDQHFGTGAWKFREIRAGVRPATAGAYPIVGPHPEIARLFAFNGFGSKGSLQVPYFADALLDSLYQQKPLPREVLPARFVKEEPVRPKRWLATNIAQEGVQQILKPGDIAIDATAGNGHDTHWLCESVGETGHVFAYDIQEQAIDAVRSRLQKSGLSERATLNHQSHETLLETIPREHHGNLAAIVYNLGYLPGGDTAIVTTPDTTLAALEASLALLKPGGILSVTLYPGHPGGRQETIEVLDWANSLSSDKYSLEIVRHPKGVESSPFPVFVRRL